MDNINITYFLVSYGINAFIFWLWSRGTRDTRDCLRIENEALKSTIRTQDLQIREYLKDELRRKIEVENLVRENIRKDENEP